LYEGTLIPAGTKATHVYPEKVLQCSQPPPREEGTKIGLITIARDALARRQLRRSTTTTQAQHSRWKASHVNSLGGGIGVDKYNQFHSLSLSFSRFIFVKMEKSLPTVELPQAPKAASKGAWSYVRSFLTSLALLWFVLGPVNDYLYKQKHSGSNGTSNAVSSCVQPAPLFPPTTDEALERMWEYVGTEAFKNASIVRHSGAVKIDTSSFDNMGPVGEDKRWDNRYGFHDYLEATFPRMHKDLKLEKVNTFGLLYTWQGSDESLKPLVLMAHQDVVPVPASTVDAWTHPPFSGHFDGKFIWGRGSSDCKNQLIAEMEVIELLLDAGYKPKRTIVLSFGFDEEISGREGAGSLAPFLIDRYGENGVAAVVDEGAGFAVQWYVQGQWSGNMGDMLTFV